MTLRSPVPVLLSQLLEAGIGVSVTPSRIVGDEMTVYWSSVYVNLIESEADLHGHVHIPFEPGVHGANCIALEKELVRILKIVMDHQLHSEEPK